MFCSKCGSNLIPGTAFCQVCGTAVSPAAAAIPAPAGNAPALAPGAVSPHWLPPVIVTDMDGNRITFGRASGRYFAKIISGLIPLGIGYILAGVTEKKQALHDMIASCLVLRA